MVPRCMGTGRVEKELKKRMLRIHMSQGIALYVLYEMV
jgi:hypothetical protein